MYFISFKHLLNSFRKEWEIFRVSWTSCSYWVDEAIGISVLEMIAELYITILEASFHKHAHFKVKSFKTRNSSFKRLSIINQISFLNKQTNKPINKLRREVIAREVISAFFFPFS